MLSKLRVLDPIIIFIIAHVLKKHNFYDKKSLVYWKFFLHPLLILDLKIDIKPTMLLKLGVLNTKRFFLLFNVLKNLILMNINQNRPRFSHFMHSVLEIYLNPLMLPKLRVLVPFKDFFFILMC